MATIPKRVIVWQNGMVMVFDHQGEQMPEYQGRLADVRARLAAVLPESAWEFGDWQTGVIVAQPQPSSN